MKVSLKNYAFNKWVASGAQEKLDELLRDGTIPIDLNLMKPKIAYTKSRVFQQIEYVYFRGKLYERRKKFAERKATAEEDAAALASDLRLHPRPKYNSRGELRWEGSDAEKFLKLDLPAYLKNRHMKPKDLWVTRNEYRLFKLKIFRKHIYQEIKTEKFHNYLKAKEVAKKEKIREKYLKQKQRKEGEQQDVAEEQRQQPPEVAALPQEVIDLITEDEGDNSSHGDASDGFGSDDEY